METEDEKLEKCPFCDRMPKIRLIKKYCTDMFLATFQIGCDDCGIHFEEHSRWNVVNGRIQIARDGYAACIRRWNRRF